MSDKRTDICISYFYHIITSIWPSRERKALFVWKLNCFLINIYIACVHYWWMYETVFCGQTVIKIDAGPHALFGSCPARNAYVCVFMSQPRGNKLDRRRATKLLSSFLGIDKIAFDHSPSHLNSAVYSNQIGAQRAMIGAYVHPCDPDTITLSLSVMGYLITPIPHRLPITLIIWF